MCSMKVQDCNDQNFKILRGRVKFELCLFGKGLKFQDFYVPSCKQLISVDIIKNPGYDLYSLIIWLYLNINDQTQIFDTLGCCFFICSRHLGSKWTMEYRLRVGLMILQIENCFYCFLSWRVWQELMMSDLKLREGSGSGRKLLQLCIL